LGPPLKTGWGGLQEYMDIYLTEDVPGAGERINRFLPEGIAVKQTEAVNEGVPKLAKDICAAAYAVEVDAEELAGRWNGLRAAGGRVSRRLTSSNESYQENKRLPELEDAIENHLTGGNGRSSGAAPELIELGARQSGGRIVFEYTCTMPSGKSLTVDDLLAPFAGETGTFKLPPRTVRKALFVQRNGEFLSPICKGVVRESS
jgi:hypothetical protein